MQAESAFARLTSAPARSVNVLLLEDSDDDAFLVEAELRDAGYAPDVVRAESESDFIEALQNDIDVVLADYSLPAYDALSALRRMKECEHDAPFIIVSGVISEQAAVEAMRAGASDYLLKDRLARLGLAVEHALEKRDADREIERERERRRQELEALVENSPDAVLRFDRRKRHVYLNRAAEHFTGRSRDALLGRTGDEVGFPEESHRRWSGAIDEAVRTGQEIIFEYAFTTPRGKRYFDVRMVPEMAPDGTCETILAVARDVTKRKHDERRLEESEERWRRFVDRHPDAIIVMVEGRFVYANEQAAVLHRLSSTAELVGRCWQEFVAASMYDEIEAFIEQLVTGHDVDRKAIRIIRPDGSERDVEIHASPIRYAGRNAFQAVLYDVTDRREYEARLIEARRHAEAVARLKSAILTNLSHEIRTPLSTILSFAELLREFVDPDGAELLCMLGESGERLMSTIESVLELSRLESEEIELAPRLLNISRLLDEAIAAVRPAAARKNLDVSSRTEGLDHPIMLDLSVVAQVLRHLIHNAVKFTEAGSVDAEVALVGSEVRIKVSDTGIGIDPAFLPRLFDAFEQESSGLSRGFEGSGLGLAIVKRVVDCAGGRISVTSRPDEGSTFEVWLPNAAPGGDV